MLLGLGYGRLISAGQTVAIRHTGGPNAGLAVGSFVDGGTGLGPTVLGPVAAAAGYQAMFLVSAVLAAIGLAWYVFVASDWARRRRS